MKVLRNKKWIFFLLAAIILLPIIPILNNKSEEVLPKSKDGFLDLSTWDFNNDGNVKLDGYWEFYPNRLLTPGELNEKTLPSPQYIQVPSRWVKEVKAGTMEDDGIGTYRLQIKVNKNIKTLGLRVKNIRISYKIFINGEEVAASGNPAPDKKSGYVAYNLPMTVIFPLNNDSGSVDLLIQVANINYYNGGIIQSVYLGNEKDVIYEYVRLIIMDVLITAFLLLTGIYYFVIYLKKKEEKKLLYMAVFCISFAYIVSTGNAKVLYFFINFIPYLTVIKLRTAFVAFSIIFMCLFIREMSKELISLICMKVITVMMSCCMFLLLSTPDSFLPVTEKTVTTFYILTYILVALLLIRAAVCNKHEGLSKKAVIFLLLLDLQFISEYISSILYYYSILNSFLVSNLTFAILLLGLCYMFADEYIKAYKDIQIMNNNLIATDKIKDEFLSHTSNEFKSPLNTIMQITGSLLNQEEDFKLQEQKDNLLYILSISARLSGMVNDIIDYQNLKNNKLKLYKNDFDLYGLVNAVLETVKYMKKGNRIDLINDIPSGSYFVSADENRLEQILYNLIDNSLKFTEDGFIRISAQEMDKYIIIRVWDTGKGMDEKTCNEIFKEYVPQIDGQSEGNIATGMGLSVSKLLASNMGGDLYLEWSELDKGSIFILKLPKAAQDRKDERLLRLTFNRMGIKEKIRNRNLSVVKEAAVTENSNSLKPKILLVDDDIFNVKLMFDIFKEDFDPITAYNGTQALEIINKNKNIDLVLLDAVLPDISGYEVCQKIRNQHTLFEMPVLLLTVRNAPEDIETGLESGANDFLVKPFNSKELITRVKTLRKMKEAMQEAINIETIFLQSQIKQHFLYNSLNSIVSLCYSDGERAGNLLGELSHYLRSILEIDPHHSYIDLEKEISLVKSYIELEKARFGHRLKVHLEYDKSVLKYQIPAFIIQPIVENAIRHGLMHSISGGIVTITIRKSDGNITIIVEDDGQGMDDNKLSDILNNTLNGSIGLKNVNKRLMNEYGESLRIKSTVNEGTCVTIIIPVNDNNLINGE